MPGGGRHASRALQQRPAGPRTRRTRFCLQYGAAPAAETPRGPVVHFFPAGGTCSSPARRPRWPLRAGPGRRGRHAPVPAVATGRRGRRQAADRAVGYTPLTCLRVTRRTRPEPTCPGRGPDQSLSASGTFPCLLPSRPWNALGPACFPAWFSGPDHTTPGGL